MALIPHEEQEPLPNGGHHTPYELVRATLDGLPWSRGTRRATAVLMPNDTAWNSASTKHDVHGPCAVTWIEYRDGAIDTLV